MVARRDFAKAKAVTPAYTAVEHEAWTRDAECVRGGHDPEIWFPAPSDIPGLARAKEVCLGCPVRAECLEEALRLKDYHGVRGGLTPDQLRAEGRRRARRKQ